MPILSSTAASRTEPAVGAVVCAGGSQVCSGKTGTLTASPATSSAATSVWVPTGMPCPPPWARTSEVGGARLGDEREDADEHQRRAERGVEDEPAAGVRARRGVVGVAEPGDEHPHRDEDELEGDEEEDRVAGVEGGQRTELDEQQAGVEGRGGAALRRPVAGCAARRRPRGSR